MKHIIGLIFACVLLTACVNYDSQRIQPTRANYNEALQYGDKYQLLLNIVRYRYTDLPYFFSVNNIISQINYSNTFTGSVNNTWAPPPVNFSTSGSDSVTVGEAPTITYTPLQGDAFIKKMLTPIDLRMIYLMVHTTASDLDRLLRTFVAQFGVFDNEIAVTVHAYNKKVLNREYRQMSRLLSNLIECNAIKIKADMVEEKFAMQMILKDFAKLSPKKQSILKKLGFSRTNSTVWVMQDKTPGLAPPAGLQPKKPMAPTADTNVEETQSSPLLGSSKLAAIPKKFRHKMKIEKPKVIVLVQTKPLLTAMLYLSKGVHVSAEEVENRIAVGTRLPNRKLLNWQYYVADIFDVHVCQKRPRNVFLAVQYRGQWYYIRDDDISTKATFYIIGVLMNLYEGNVQNGLTPFYSILT